LDYFLFVIFLTTCAVPAAAGALFKPGEWYRGLDKPAWTPPNLSVWRRNRGAQASPASG